MSEGSVDEWDYTPSTPTVVSKEKSGAAVQAAAQSAIPVPTTVAETVRTEARVGVYLYIYLMLTCFLLQLPQDDAVGAISPPATYNVQVRKRSVYCPRISLIYVACDSRAHPCSSV
jgi:hypothetical protein